MSENVNKTAAVPAEEKNVAPAPTVPVAPPTPMDTSDEVSQKLIKYGASDGVITKIKNDFGVESIDELAALDADDLINAGMKLAKAKKLVAELNAPAPATTATTNTTAAVIAESPAITRNPYEGLLPNPPSDESWLSSLKTGGIIKVNEASYIAAIRAALADRAGLYKIPETLSKAMEKFADETEEQVDPIFYTLRKSLTRRTYGDIFSAIDGLDGTFITESRRNQFLSRIRDVLWPAIADSYQALDGWFQTYRASYADPSTFFTMLNGGPAGLANVPDTSVIHDAGDTLVNSINSVFRGTGVQVAAALAYDANTILGTMDDSRLPGMIGAKNYEMMLKKIGASISSNYVRLEKNLVKYVMSFVKHDTITSDVEVNYFIALYQLGTQINWRELGVAANPTRTNQMNATTFNGLTGKPVL